MAPPGYAVHIMDVFTFPPGSPTTKQSVWQTNHGFSLGAVHSIDPPGNFPFRVGFILRHEHHIGYNNDASSFDAIWRPAKILFATGNYTTATPATMSFLDMPTIPVSPARSLDDALSGAADRETLFNGLVDGDLSQSTLNGYWSLVVLVMVLDPTAPDRVLSMEVSEPWHYYIRELH